MATRVIKLVKVARCGQTAGETTGTAGKLVDVPADAIKFLSELEGPLFLIFICGRARLGKSQLGNMVIGKLSKHIGEDIPQTFTVTDSLDTFQTEGMDLAVLEVKVGQISVTVGIVDVEGADFGTKDAEASEALRAIVPGLSHVVVMLNSDAIDVSVLDAMALMAAQAILVQMQESLEIAQYRFPAFILANRTNLKHSDIDPLQTKLQAESDSNNEDVGLIRFCFRNKVYVQLPHGEEKQLTSKTSKYGLAVQCLTDVILVQLAEPSRELFECGSEVRDRLLRLVEGINKSFRENDKAFLAPRSAEVGRDFVTKTCAQASKDILHDFGLAVSRIRMDAKGFRHGDSKSAYFALLESECGLVARKQELLQQFSARTGLIVENFPALKPLVSETYSNLQQQFQARIDVKTSGIAFSVCQTHGHNFQARTDNSHNGKWGGFLYGHECCGKCAGGSPFAHNVGRCKNEPHFCSCDRPRLLGSFCAICREGQ